MRWATHGNREARDQEAASHEALFLRPPCELAARPVRPQVRGLALTLSMACSLLLSCSDGGTRCGRCVGVVDGDTIVVLLDGKETKIRLEGIDCPEAGQPFSMRARELTSSLVSSKTICLRVVGRDRYERLLARVNVGPTDVNVALVRSGLAWHYKRYSNDEELARAESLARAEGIGLWSESAAVAPWERRAAGRQLTGSTQTPAGEYRGNTRSGVFHRSTCQFFNCDNCAMGFGSREEALRAGYRPCGVCKP